MEKQREEHARRHANLGLYIHVPFCRKTCAYCDFYFKHSLQRDEAAFQAALISEIRTEKSFFAGLPTSLATQYHEEGLKTLYLGGGTPSLLSGKTLRAIRDVLEETFILRNLREVTLEVNPEDLTLAKLDLWKDFGVTRLSIGVQSFFAKHGTYLGRELVSWSAAKWAEWVAAAKQAGISHLSLDLLYGFPSLSDEEWQEALTQAVALEVDHLSLYQLTVEPRTRLAKEIERTSLNAKKKPEETASLRHVQMAEEILGAAGLVRYEISNFARPGAEGLHNQSYWTGGAYLGLGPSAHSFNGADTRWESPRNLGLYLKHFAKIEPLGKTTELPQIDKTAKKSVKSTNATESTTKSTEIVFKSAGITTKSAGSTTNSAGIASKPVGNASKQFVEIASKPTGIDWTRERIVLSERDRFNELIIARLRNLIFGLSLDEVEHVFGASFVEGLRLRAKPLMEQGWLTVKQTARSVKTTESWVISPDGRIFGDHVMRELLLD